MWWMVLASSWNKVSSYLWASVFLHAEQCWSVPVTSQANPEFDCWVYQGLLETYHLRQTATGVAGVGTSKRRCSLTCFVESCATEATFLLCLLKASLPPPKYHCRSMVQQPRIWYRGAWGVGPEAPLSSSKISTITMPGVSKYSARILQFNIIL